jgi:hypothetical protein
MIRRDNGRQGRLPGEAPREEAPMRPRIDGPIDRATTHPHLTPGPVDPLRDGPVPAVAVAELFSGVFRRDLQAFFPRIAFETLPGPDEPTFHLGPDFAFEGRPTDDGIGFRLFGRRHRLWLRNRAGLSSLDLRMIRAVAAVLTQRCDFLFDSHHPARLELYRGGSEDHYVAAFIEPESYAPGSRRASRIAATIQTLRTAALSTYENRRVSTGALLLGDDPVPTARPCPTPPDAIAYGVELTAIHSIHRLCDGRRTLFLVDGAGKLADIVDVARWADALVAAGPIGFEETYCARAYQWHATATRSGGHVCLVLSPNQEIKLFAEGRQAFAFSHGRWRILDPATRFTAWATAVSSAPLARTLFQAALDMAEDRQGGLFVVVRNPDAAIGRLIARHDLVDHVASGHDPSEESPDVALADRGPLARRALHYLARGRVVTELDPAVLEAIASLDGALVADPAGRILAFGAILRHHDAPELLGLGRAEGARTTAALFASLYGPVLKVSEDGIVSFFLDGTRVWDL